MEQFQGSERLILQTILDSPKNSAGFVEGSKIAEASKTSPQDVQNWLKTLEGKGFVEWAKQIGGFSAFVTAKGEQAIRLTSPDQVSSVSDGSQTPIKIVPKGLRSFDEHDADFFLELLPGPRHANGLPESIHFWKTRIEETAPDRTFAVGVIYGPSGCGKSSLVKAGLLPLLSESVLPVYLEATADDTEVRLLKGLGRHFPDLHADVGLRDTLSALRAGTGSSATNKVLIVLDQFEQWLHAKRSAEGTELALALGQCDGERLQALLMVRDDFWMALTRFMGEMGIALKQWENFAAVDLFDLRRARKVLTAFGQAFGTLPDRLEDQGTEIPGSSRQWARTGRPDHLGEARPVRRDGQGQALDPGDLEGSRRDGGNRCHLPRRDVRLDRPEGAPKVGRARVEGPASRERHEHQGPHAIA